MKLRILHLSDLHFKEDNIPQDVVISSLQETIRALCENESARPNLLVLTGDIAHGGKSDQYKVAKEFIDNVAGFCGIGKDRIFIIPGNHDVDRSKLLAAYRRMMSSYKEEEELHELLGAEEIFNSIRKTTSEFYEFLNFYGEGKITVEKYGEYTIELPFGSNEKGLRLICLNSALLCGYDGDEKQHLALGLAQVDHCYDHVAYKQQVAITLVHHPASCFHPCDRASWSTLQRGSDIILSGHVHDASGKSIHASNEGDTVLIAAGAAYEYRQSDNNGFNVIELDTNTLEGNVLFYKYLHKEHLWIRNKDIYSDKDGVYNFTINKQGYPIETSEAKPNISDSISERKEEVVKKESIKRSPAHVVLPIPPKLYAWPRYIGSHEFVGRKRELEDLDEWAKEATPYTILLFEAMGGMGKSMLTWEWATVHKARKDWKGVFWYSFYEKGAVMQDFCQRALAYMKSVPLENYQKRRTYDLADELLQELNSGSWLVVLDGLERVLEGYNTNRFAEDDEEGAREASKSGRDARFCILDEDDDLLLRLTMAKPSKILVSTRMVPEKLINNSENARPGVQRIALAGLRSGDAEAMFRSCGISGNSDTMQIYLSENCGCHPLTMGVLAGIINKNIRHRGNFDTWLVDAIDGAGKLDFSTLDLKQKQNHILAVAMNMLPQKSMELLGMLTLIYESVDYETLDALNPHMPLKPEDVDEPVAPKTRFGSSWAFLSKENQEFADTEYNQDLQKWEKSKSDQIAWAESEEYKLATQKLAETVLDLEKRGLVQYDRFIKRYDLHPVVRSVAGGRLKAKETARYGQRVVDHFSTRTHVPYLEVKNLADVSDAIHVVRTLLRMNKMQEAYDVFKADLSDALLYNLEAHKIILTLLRPFFPQGWDKSPIGLNRADTSFLHNGVIIALDWVGEIEENLVIWKNLILQDIKDNRKINVRVGISNLAVSYSDLNKIATQKRLLEYVLQLAELSKSDEELFAVRLDFYEYYSKVGDWNAAETMWQQLNPMGRNWYRKVYRTGDAEFLHAQNRFYQGILEISEIENAIRLAKNGNSRTVVRTLHWLKGEFYAERCEWRLAAESYEEALRMAREGGFTDSSSEIGLMRSKWHQGMLHEPEQEAARLIKLDRIDSEEMAKLWFDIGNKEEAKKWALRAYKRFWADGEPYVKRYYLNKTTSLLEQLGEPIPQLEINHERDKKEPWEYTVEEYIEQLQSQKEEYINDIDDIDKGE